MKFIVKLFFLVLILTDVITQATDHSNKIPQRFIKHKKYSPQNNQTNPLDDPDIPGIIIKDHKITPENITIKITDANSYLRIKNLDPDFVSFNVSNNAQSISMKLDQEISINLNQELTSQDITINFIFNNPDCTTNTECSATITSTATISLN
ncbi:MAG: hypothetical protein WBJ81_06080 [Rickettsiales bacterium]